MFRVSRHGLVRVFLCSGCPAPSSVHRKKSKPVVLGKLHSYTQNKVGSVYIRRRIEAVCMICRRECSPRNLLCVLKYFYLKYFYCCIYCLPLGAVVYSPPKKHTHTKHTYFAHTYVVLSLTDGLSVQRVQHQLGRFVVSEVDESVPCDDAPVPVADELNLQLLPWKRNRYTHEAHARQQA